MPPWKSRPPWKVRLLTVPPLADLDRDRRLGVRGLLHGEVLEVGPLAGGLGRLGPAAAHAEAAHHHGHVAGGLDAPQLEEGRGVLGGQRVAAGRGLAAFEKVGGDVGQHRQRVLGGDGLQACLELVGRGLGLVDQAQRLLHVLELHLRLLRRALGPQADDHGEDEDDGQNVLSHRYLHLEFNVTWFRRPSRRISSIGQTYVSIFPGKGSACRTDGLTIGLTPS